MPQASYLSYGVNCQWIKKMRHEYLEVPFTNPVQHSISDSKTTRQIDGNMDLMLINHVN